MDLNVKINVGPACLIQILSYLHCLRNVDIHHLATHAIAHHMLRLGCDVFRFADLVASCVQPVLVNAHARGKAHVVLICPRNVKDIEAKDRARDHVEGEVYVDSKVMPPLKIDGHLGVR